MVWKALANGTKDVTKCSQNCFKRGDEGFLFYQWETDIKVFEVPLETNRNPLTWKILLAVFPLLFHIFKWVDLRRFPGICSSQRFYSKIWSVFMQNATNNVFFLILFIEAVGVYTLKVWLSKWANVSFDAMSVFNKNHF